MNMPPPAAPVAPASEERREAPTTPESLRRLSAEVDALGTAPEDPRHAGLARALRALANALELLPDAPVGDQSPLKLRDAAQRLESATESSLERADVLKDALQTAFQALVTRKAPAGRETEYRDSVEALSRSTDDLNPDRPVLEQRQTAAAAFRAATDAIYLARGGEPPFGQAESDDSPRITVGSMEDELEQARADVLELGQSRWTHARQAMARSLASIADVIDASDGSREQRDRTSKIRFQAERLRSADGTRFGQAEWVKVGLTTALDALDNQLGDQRAMVTPWTRAARRAVKGIEEGDSLAFQRAAVQDGFRSTVDAFVITSQSANHCR